MKKDYTSRLRRAIMGLMILTLLFSMTLPTYAQVQRVPTAGIAINGKVVDGINPITINGKYYVPFIHLSKILGYNNIKFDQRTARTK